MIVPCRNEVDHIVPFCRSVAAQQLPEGWTLEVWVADGMSNDGTRERLADWCQQDSRFAMIDNPGRIVSTGLNRCIAQAQGEFIVRLDVHTVYAPDYVAQCLATWQATGADNVGGPWRAQGQDGPAGRVQRAVAAAFQSKWVAGGARSRDLAYNGEVDTVYLGAWRREELVRLGGFDPALVRNQDDELALRIVRGGGRVWQSASIRSWYTPRASFAALFRQFWQYGYWKVAVIRKHRLPASPRHLVPFAFVATVVLLALAGLAWPPARAVLAGVLVLYAAGALGSAAALVRPWRAPLDWAGIAWATTCMHLGYGLGFAAGLWDFVLRRRGASAAATRLTR